MHLRLVPPSGAATAYAMHLRLVPPSGSATVHAKERG